MEHLILNKPWRKNNNQFVYDYNDYILKKWIKPYKDITWLENQVFLIRKVDCDYVLDYYEEKNYIVAKFKKIQGQDCENILNNVFFIKKIINFICSHYFNNFPIYQNDPSSSNIIYNCGSFNYCDYDNIIITTNLEYVLQHIQKKCISSFVENIFSKLSEEIIINFVNTSFESLFKIKKGNNG